MRNSGTPISREELAAARSGLILRQLFFVFSALRERFFVALARAGHPGLTMQHSLLLRNLPYDGITMAELARTAGVSRQGIAKIARDLEARGYLTIRENPADARGVLLRFSRGGRVLARAIVETARQVDEDLEGMMGGTGMRQFRTALANLHDELVAAKASSALPRRPRRRHSSPAKDRKAGSGS